MDRKTGAPIEVGKVRLVPGPGANAVTRQRLEATQRAAAAVQARDGASAPFIPGFIPEARR